MVKIMSCLNNYSHSIGVVVIGRNEGVRLKKCLESIIKSNAIVVYVDSGSTDNSIDIAKSAGANLVYLDLSRPFTAARARNEGFNRLRELDFNLSYVQFIDGDCEIIDSWLEQASEYLIEHPDVAVVGGRRRERYPEASVYNMLCDIEWDTPVGESKACGGDALMRIEAVQQVAGFNPTVIAGEESELCVRIRAKGWKVWRLDMEMTIHDANITRFSQWWKRNVRSGYAYALGAFMHGQYPEYHRVHTSRRIWFWGLYLPVTIFLSSTVEPFLFIFLLLYPIQVVRIKFGNPHIVKNGWLYALFTSMGKFPEVQGQLTFLFNRLMKKQGSIIEYKS